MKVNDPTFASSNGQIAKMMQDGDIIVINRAADRHLQARKYVDKNSYKLHVVALEGDYFYFGLREFNDKDAQRKLALEHHAKVVKGNRPLRMQPDEVD